jgi:hypothetical protein
MSWSGYFNFGLISQKGQFSISVATRHALSARQIAGMDDIHAPTALSFQIQ